VKRAFDYDRKVAFGEIIPKKIDVDEQIKAAITIQRAWRRFAARKAMEKRIARLETMLNMTIPSWQSREIIAKDEENFEQKRALIPIFDARAAKTTSDERTRVNFSNKILNPSR
jgi:hypothetical protein